MIKSIVNKKNKSTVGRSAHGIHFSERERYEKYRQRCLELFGEDYYKLPHRIHDNWHPFRIQ